MNKKMIKSKMNKKGWIEIIEAVTAMLLIAAVILILLNRGYSKNEDISERIHDSEIAMLREIQFNNSLRASILKMADGDLPVKTDNTKFPIDVKQKIIERTPELTNCIAMICNISSNCLNEGLGKKEVHVQSVIINPTPGVDEENWRRLKIFCYLK